MTPASPFAPAKDSIRVRVKVAPRAAATRVIGVERDGAGDAVLKVSVTAPPDSGRANAALMALLAKAWRVPKSSLSIVAGAGARRKTVRISGDPAARLAVLTRWLEGFDG